MSASKKRNIILFVDDEKICHTLVELIIPNFTDFKVVGAFNGKDAIALAKRYSNEICLILSDITLPDISGYEVLKTLRQDKRFVKTPFIFQSGLVDQEEVICKNAGEDVRIIYKPYKQVDLLKSINEVLEAAKET